MGGCFSRRSTFVDPFDIDSSADHNLPSSSNDSGQGSGLTTTEPHVWKPVTASEIVEDEVDTSKTFMQFDCVSDYSDHYFRNQISNANPPPYWQRRIQNEWKALQKDLPESIFVRIYQDRMDLLRAAIVGPAGTPYHDGLFFFDICFPQDYPRSPPGVYYHSGGLRLNPNLYSNGFVCLSLLNTWFGRGSEKWKPSSSTMLQVLVSIQGLVLNANPYFNEPEHSGEANTVRGRIRSLDYNGDVFLLSCRTMIYSIKNPPKHFEELVMGHFRKHGCIIFEACRAYMAGADIGSNVKTMWAWLADGGIKKDASLSEKLRELYPVLLHRFYTVGLDCSDLKLSDDLRRR